MKTKRILALLFTLLWGLTCAQPAYAVPPSFTQFAGTNNPYWGVGTSGTTGAIINDNGGVLEAKNAGNTGLIIFRSADPVGVHDVATKEYVDTKTFTGDVTGTAGAATVTGIRSTAVPTLSVGCLQWNGTSLLWGTCGGGGFTPGTDLSGTSSSQTVVGIEGRPLLSSAPSTGNGYYWSGSVWAPGALNLAGGSASITGLLPIANGGFGSVGTNGQIFATVGGVAGWNSLAAGDLTLSATLVPTVTGLGGVTLPTPPGSSTTILQDSAGVLSWAAPAAGTSVTGTGLWYSAAGSLNSAAVGISGDASAAALSGGNLPLTVTGLRGTSVPSLSSGYLHYNGSSFVWDSPGVQTVIFQPGGTAGSNVYTSWSSLVTAANVIQGPVIVFFDGSHNGGACTVPSGSWAFTSAAVLFDGPPLGAGGSSVVVTFASGATLSGVASFRNAKFLNVGSAAVIAISSGSTVKRITFDRNAFVDATGSAPFVSVTGSTTAQVLLYDSLVGQYSTTAVLTSGGASSVLQVSVEGLGAAIAGSITGAGASVFINSSAAQNLTAIATTYNTLASSVGYNDSLTLPTFGVSQTQAAIDYLKGHSPIFSSVTTGYANWTGSAWALTALPTSLPPSGTAGGRLAGTYPNPTLAASGITAATYGSATQVPVCAFSADGTASTCTNTTITAALGSATGHATVSQGGTGLTTLTAHDVLLGEGTSNVGLVGLNDAQVLVGQTSADPAGKTISQDLTLTDTGVATVNSVTLPTTSTKFDVISGSTHYISSGVLSAYGAMYLGSGTLSSSQYTLWGFGGSTYIGGAPIIFRPSATVNIGRIDANGWQLFSETPAFDGATGVLSLTDTTSFPTAAANGHTVIYSHNNVLGTNGNGLEFSKFSAGPVIAQIGQTTDTAAANMVIEAQSAWASAMSHPQGGGIIVSGGAGANAALGGAAALLNGDGATELVVASGEIVGASGSTSATSDVVPQGMGVKNTQNGTSFKYRLFCSTHSSAGVQCTGGPILTVPTNTIASFVVHWTARDVTTNNAADDSTGVCTGAVHNVSGVMNAIGSNAGLCVPVLNTPGTSGKANSAGVTYGVSGTTLPFNAVGYTGTDSVDWVLDVYVTLD